MLQTQNPRISKKAETLMTLLLGQGVMAPYTFQEFTDHWPPLRLKLQHVWSPPQDSLAQNWVLLSSVFWHFPAACEILAPQPEIKPMPPALRAWSLNH